MPSPQAPTEVEPAFLTSDLQMTLDMEDSMNAAINAGRLPFDTYLRLMAIGICQPDWQDERRSLQFNIINDIIDNLDDPEAMRPDTQRILLGDRPNAVVDMNHHYNRDDYTALDPMYYRMPNLVRVIKSQRAEAGQTLTEVPPHWYFTTPEEAEVGRCAGLARPLWRTIVKRIHPEWLNRPSDFWPDSFSMFGVYTLSDKTKARRLVGAAVISDEVVFDIYDEAVRTGVKGIGPRGRESLRELLADEHPELH